MQIENDRSVISEPSTTTKTDFLQKQEASCLQLHDDSKKLPEDNFAAKQTGFRKRGFLSATPFIPKFDNSGVLMPTYLRTHIFQNKVINIEN